jgi:cytochrome c553
MKHLLLSLSLVFPALVMAQEADLFVKGKAADGAAKAAVCAGCHNGAVGGAPKINGQSSAYIAEQLQAFKSQKRVNAVMYPQAMGLSDQDMADLAAHFASQKLIVGATTTKDAKVLALGEKLYRAGDAGRHLPACGACHGPVGAGNPAAGYPRITAQVGVYTREQLGKYADGTRNHGDAKRVAMMHAVAKKLSPQEMDALAAYINGLNSQ